MIVHNNCTPPPRLQGSMTKNNTSEYLRPRRTRNIQCTHMWCVCVAAVAIENNLRVPILLLTYIRRCQQNKYWKCFHVNAKMHCLVYFYWAISWRIHFSGNTKMHSNLQIYMVQTFLLDFQHIQIFHTEVNKSHQNQISRKSVHW